MPVGSQDKVLMFCTSYVSSSGKTLDSWSTRYRIWVDAVKQSSIKYSQILIVDDCSPVLPQWPDCVVVAANADTQPDTSVVIARFETHMGRRDVSDFPGWVRSFFFAARYAKRFGFTKIVHIESDAFAISTKMQSFINDLDRGWTTFWCPRWTRAESAIQVIAGSESLKTYFDFADQDVEAFAGVVIEDVLPFTHVETGMLGDRYNEYQSFIPTSADWCAQGDPPADALLSEFYWWLRPCEVIKRIDSIRREEASARRNQRAGFTVNEQSIRIDVSLAGNLADVLLEGWSAPEAQGCWMTGPRSRICIPTPAADGPFKLAFTLVPNIIDGKILKQGISVVYRDITLVSTDVKAPLNLSVTIPSVPGIDSGIELLIIHSDGVSPAFLGLSDDVRELSFLLQEIEISASVFKNEYQDIRFVVDGDSLVNGVAPVLQKLINQSGDHAHGVLISDFSVSGDTLVSRLEVMTTTNLQSISHSSIVLIGAGSNDIRLSSDIDRTYTSLVKSLYQYCSSVREMGHKVVVTTVLPRLDISDQLEAARLSFNDHIRKEWTQFADSIADWASDPEMGSSNFPTNAALCADGIHPTAAGYHRLAEMSHAALLSAISNEKDGINRDAKRGSLTQLSTQQ